MKILVRILILPLVLSAPSLSAGEIFKCLVADGSVTFSDTPCDNADDEAIDIDDLDSRVTTYETEYSDGYGEADYPQRYGQENQADSPYAEEIARNQQRSTTTPNYIDIPSEPVKPDAPDTVPGAPHMVPTTQGGQVLRSGERSYIDPVTGRVEGGEFIGGKYNHADPEASQAHMEAMREYENAQYGREVAIESEKHAAKFQDRNASPQYCGEMQVKLARAKQEGDSLERQMDQLKSSRPSSRESAEQRSNHYKQTKKSKEDLKDKMSANRRQQQEYGRNYRSLCR